jgi:hypothetical protein
MLMMLPTGKKAPLKMMHDDKIYPWGPFQPHFMISFYVRRFQKYKKIFTLWVSLYVKVLSKMLVKSAPDDEKI